MNPLKIIPLSLITVFLSGCLLGKDYTRPELDMPPEFPGQAATMDKAAEDISWWALFNDEKLNALIERGLKNNLDLLIAADRVEQAKGALGFTNSDLFPAITGSGYSKKTRFSSIASVPLPNNNIDVTRDSNRYTLDLLFEVDLWGAYRRASEAARAQLAGTKAYECLIRQSVVTGVATSYFTIKDLRRQLKFADDTLTSREESLKLWDERDKVGMASAGDIEAARSLVAGAKLAKTLVEQQLSEANSAMAILIGQYPDGQLITQSEDNNLPLKVPDQLPASLLERRPDLIQAEQAVVAANANVGNAIAQFLPAVSIAGYLGSDAAERNDLFSGPARIYSIGPNVSVPIFQGGKLWGYYDQRKAELAESVDRYKQSVLNAFKEAYDARIAIDKTSEAFTHQQHLVYSLGEVLRLARISYDTGTKNYLDVLDAEREYFQAGLNLSQRRRQQELALVQFYKALGGGWEVKPETEQLAAAKP